MNGEYQSGCSLVGAIRNSPPSDDWCSVESMTPNTVRPIVMRTAHMRAFGQPSHSNTGGRNSMPSTVR